MACKSRKWVIYKSRKWVIYKSTIYEVSFTPPVETIETYSKKSSGRKYPEDQWKASLLIGPKGNYDTTIEQDFNDGSIPVVLGYIMS